MGDSRSARGWDEDLMENYKDGDVDAFEILLQRHEKFFFILRKIVTENARASCFKIHSLE